jgi:xylulokinase
MPQYLLAHDLGTSGNKATLYSIDGQLIASCSVPYPTHYFNGNWSEQDPNDWWTAICDSSKKLTATIDAADIGVIALSGQMMGCTVVDHHGRALRPSMLYSDQRAAPQAETLLANIGQKPFYNIVGHRISPSYSLEKLMWVRDNEPDIFKATRYTLCAKDYINFRLTGEIATDYSDASGTNAFDLGTFTWSSKILDCARIDERLFPRAANSTEILGTITTEAAEATGLKAGTPVALGGGDGSCAGVGVGCIKPGTAYNYLGSSSWIALTVEKPIVDEHMRTMNWAHCVPGYLHPSGTMQTAGSSHTWLKDTLCEREKLMAEQTGRSPFELIENLITQSPAGSNGILFLPYMLGERTPWWNPDARGAFVGLNLASTRADMSRAVLEGITMNLGIIVNIFRRHVPIDTMTVIGGGAQSAFWRQMMADIYDCTIDTLNVQEEATSMGAAVIGGVAAGLLPDFEVINRFITVVDTVEPNREHQKCYKQLQPIFEQTYVALKDVYANLAAIQK